MPVLIVLIVVDLVDAGVNRWFVDHAFLTSALVSVLVLLITVLNVDHVVHRRQLRARSQVTAAQAAILRSQAQRTADRVRDALGDAARRESAVDEMRTYMAMLLVSAPVLIDAPPARAFLENAQLLGGQLSWGLSHPARSATADFRDRLDSLVAKVDSSARPLLSCLDLAQLTAVDNGDSPPASAPDDSAEVAADGG